MGAALSKGLRGAWSYLCPYYMWRMLPPLEDGETILLDRHARWRRSWLSDPRGWLTVTNRRLVFLGRVSNPVALLRRRDSVMVTVSIGSVITARRRRTWEHPVFGELKILCSTGESVRFQTPRLGQWVADINRLVEAAQIP